MRQAAGILNIKFIAGLRSRSKTEAAKALHTKAVMKKMIPSLKRSFQREERPGVRSNPVVETTRTVKSTNIAVNRVRH